jgi:hypothetical protein
MSGRANTPLLSASLQGMPHSLAKTRSYGFYFLTGCGKRIDAEIGGYGQNAGHRCVQKGMTGIWGTLATSHPGVSVAPFHMPAMKRS